jgi:hypothetical protein
MSVRAVRAGEGAVAVVEVDEPPGDGELLDIVATSVCASDLSYVGWGFDKVLGHELAGRRADGTAVVVEALYGCMHCDQCRRGTYNLCPTHAQRALGVSVDGGMAERFRAPPERLVPVPDGLDVHWTYHRAAGGPASSWSRPTSAPPSSTGGRPGTCRSPPEQSAGRSDAGGRGQTTSSSSSTGGRPGTCRSPPEPGHGQMMSSIFQPSS